MMIFRYFSKNAPPFPHIEILAVENLVPIRCETKRALETAHNRDMRLASFALFCLTLAGQSLTKDKVAALARNLAEEVDRHTTPVQAQEVQNYVAQLGAKIAAQLPAPSRSFTFSVVSTGEDNALHEPLAIPGGYIFVPSNLLLTAREEAEVAGMLAQAIARLPILIESKTGTIPIFSSTVSTAV